MSPRQAWKSLPGWLQALTAGAGIVLALLLFGERWVGLPAQVEAHDKAIVELESGQRETERQFRSLVCLLSLPDSVDQRARLRECGL